MANNVWSDAAYPGPADEALKRGTAFASYVPSALPNATISHASPSATAGVDITGKGNDMTLTNRMNAGANAMAADKAAANQASQTKPLGTVEPSAPSYNVFSRPGDSFGDSQMREQNYMSLLNQAANTRGFGSKNRQAALLGAAQGIIAPGLAQVEAMNKDYLQKLNTFGQQQHDQTVLGMNGGMNPSIVDFMAGLGQIYGAHQGQPQVNRTPEQPTPATTTPTTPATVTNPVSTQSSLPSETPSSGFKPSTPKNNTSTDNNYYVYPYVNNWRTYLK